MQAVSTHTCLPRYREMTGGGGVCVVCVMSCQVEPWKFSVGFCKGLGVCNPFGRPHHHTYGTDSSGEEELAVA